MALHVKRETAVRVKIVSVTRPRSSEVIVMSVRPATRAKGDITKWMMPRSFGLLNTFIYAHHLTVK
jgi:hypothetical protein